MSNSLIRTASPKLLILAVLLLYLRVDAEAQERGRGNARVMDLSLQFDSDVGKVACLGSPDTLRVGRGETLVFRAVGTFVNHVRWADDDDMMQNAPGLNRGKPNLAQGHEKRSERFDRGTAFAIRVNPAIERGTMYTLEVKCGDIEDGPPIIIVDP